jgi:hypothetical protein
MQRLDSHKKLMRNDKLWRNPSYDNGDPRPARYTTPAVRGRGAGSSGLWIRGAERERPDVETNQRHSGSRPPYPGMNFGEKPTRLRPNSPHTLHDMPISLIKPPRRRWNSYDKAYKLAYEVEKKLVVAHNNGKVRAFTGRVFGFDSLHGAQEAGHEHPGPFPVDGNRSAAPPNGLLQNRPYQSIPYQTWEGLQRNCFKSLCFNLWRPEVLPSTNGYGLDGAL